MNAEARLWHFPLVGPFAWAVFAYLYIPIIVLVVLSFNGADSALGTWSHFSLRWYAEVFGDDSMMRALKNSLIVATVSTFAGTLLALMAALATSGARIRGQSLIEGTIGLPLIVPDIVAAIATLLLFVAVGVPLGLLSLMLAHTVFLIPIAYLPIRARLQGLDPLLGEAAADLGADPLTAFRRIILPLIWPGIISGAMLAFIGSLGDVVISYFVSGPGSTTLPVYIFSMVRMGLTPAVNAISTLLVVVSVGLLIVSYAIGRKFQ
jgi:spermidine/putrescine transport system permease protein